MRESSTDGVRAGGQARTLAAAFPARIFAGAIPGALTEVDRLLSWDWVDAATPVEASDFRPRNRRRCSASFVELAVAERQLLRERAMNAMRAGVRLRDPESTRIRGELTCGTGVEIDVDVIIEGRVTLEDGVRVGAHSIVREAQDWTAHAHRALFDRRSVERWGALGRRPLRPHPPGKYRLATAYKSAITSRSSLRGSAPAPASITTRSLETPIWQMP